MSAQSIVRRFLAPLALSATFLSAEAHAEEPSLPDAPSADAGTGARTGWVVAGGSTVALGYALSVFMASGSSSPYSAWSYVPVAGSPIMTLKTRDHCTERNHGYDDNINDYCDALPAMLVFSIVSTALQVTGGAMLGYGLLAGEAPRKQARLVISPVVVGKNGYGVGAAGSF